MTEYTTNYRHVELSDGTHRIVGFALWYQDRASAKSFFDFFQDSIDETKQLRPRVEFSRQSEEHSQDLYELSITMLTGFSVHIADIPGKYVQDLCYCLQEYGQYFLLTGFSDAAGDHVTPGCVYAAHFFYLDGQLQMGPQRGGGYPIYLLERFTDKLGTLQPAENALETERA